MNLRRKYIKKASDDRTFQKCLSVAILLKDRLKTSRLPNYTINKLCKISKIAHKTAKKYISLMEGYKLVHFEGTTNNRVLVINSIASHTQNRNINIDEMCLVSFFTAYRSVQSFVFMKVQHNKDYIKHLLQARHNPDSSKDYRKARKQVKNLVKDGKLDSVDTHYKEYGLSLERIAKEVGCCVRTVQRIVSYALLKQWVKKEKHFEWYHAPGVNYMQIDGYTFSTKNFLCIVHPNTYSLSDSISKAFNSDSKSYGYGMVFI